MAQELPITNSQLLLTSAEGIAAYGGSAPVPVRDANGQDGWRYTGKTSTQECNIDFYEEGYIPTQLGHILDAFFVATLNDNSSSNNIPALAIYTKPQGAGDYSPGNYRSRRTYSVKSNAPISVGESLQFTINRDPKINYPFGKIHLEKQTLQGPGAADEEIKQIQIEVSGFSNNNTDILFQYAGWQNPNLIASPHIAFTAYDAQEQLLTDIDNTLSTGQIFTRPRGTFYSTASSEQINLGNAASHQLIIDTNGHLKTTTAGFYENQTMAGTSALTVYGNDNGTSIDMDGYNNLAMTIEAAATTGLSPLNNLMLYVSLDNTNFVLHHGHISLYEKPTALGTYQNTFHFQNIGFRYIRLFAHALAGSPTSYTVKYSRSK
jgi:hypothetical protein